MAALAGYLASLYITGTTSVAFTNVAMTDSGDHKTFTISDATKRYWDLTQPVTVQTAPDGVTWTTVTTGFTIQYVGGKVVFSAAITGATPSCRVSASYFAYSFLGNAKTVDITISNTTEDITTFVTPPSPWKTKLANLSEATIKIGKYWLDTSFMGYLGNRCVVVAYSGANPNQRYECYAFLKQDSMKLDVSKVVTEDLDFESDGAIYFIPS
jgi:hypothetical protein